MTWREPASSVDLLQIIHYVYTLVFRRVCYAIPPLQAIELLSLCSAVSSNNIILIYEYIIAESLPLDPLRLVQSVPDTFVASFGDL